jgi:hypothetical protein
MTFFESDLVKNEMEDIANLQEIIYHNVFKFSSMTNDEKIKHINLLENLLNKQRILYTRLSLSDDPEAKKIKDKIVESAQLMGMSKNIDMNIIFNNMTQVINSMRRSLDNSDHHDV